MRVKSISQIHQILIQNAEQACTTYETIRSDLEKKYRTEWLDNMITKSEKNTLEESCCSYHEAKDLLEDFESHQW